MIKYYRNASYKERMRFIAIGRFLRFRRLALREKISPGSNERASKQPHVPTRGHLKTFSTMKMLKKEQKKREKMMMKREEPPEGCEMGRKLRRHQKKWILEAEPTDAEIQRARSPGHLMAVKEHFDRMNLACEEINTLENEIAEALAYHRQLYEEASVQLQQLPGIKKSCVQRAKPYFQLQERVKLAQSDAIEAARQFQSVCSRYIAAREDFRLAEEHLADKSSLLSEAFLNMVNNITIKVTETEREKAAAEAQHLQKTSAFSSLESQLQALEKKLKRSIRNARPYFEMKAMFQQKIMEQEKRIEELQRTSKAAKTKYAASLLSLEDISESIYEERHQTSRMPAGESTASSSDSDAHEQVSEAVDRRSGARPDAAKGKDCNTDATRETRLEGKTGNEIGASVQQIRICSDEDQCGPPPSTSSSMGICGYENSSGRYDDPPGEGIDAPPAVETDDAVDDPDECVAALNAPSQKCTMC